MAIDKSAIEREIKKQTTGYLNEELNSFNADIDAANARITENGEKDIETTKQGYEDVFRKNRLNQIINEEKTKERMANLGLIDSGLNRTQQTAIQLQAANADAAAVRNRQAAVDTIRRGISDAIAVNDAKKADYARERTSYWNEKADAMIANEYNTRVAEENARIEAKQEAYKEFMTSMLDPSVPQEAKLAMYDHYKNTWGKEDNEDMSAILDYIGYQEKPETGGNYVKKDAVGSEIGGFRLDEDGTIDGFNPQTWKNDDFIAYIGNGDSDTGRYRLEIRKQISSGTTTYEALEQTTVSDDNKYEPYNLIRYNGELYLKVNKFIDTNGKVINNPENAKQEVINKPTYYALGNGNWMGVFRNGAYNRLKNDLGMTTSAE